jgi:hypothetical protein
MRSLGYVVGLQSTWPSWVVRRYLLGPTLVMVTARGDKHRREVLQVSNQFSVANGVRPETVWTVNI